MNRRAAAIAIAAATEQAIVGALRAGVQRALREHPDCSLIVGGGVAANGPLRAALADVANEERRAIVVPPLKWCTDNAAMIAWAGVERLSVNSAGDALSTSPRARWPLATGAI